MVFAHAWIVLASACACCWGVGYSFLQPVREVVHPHTIQTIVGIANVLVGFFGSLGHHDLSNYHVFATSWKIPVYTAVYVSLFVGASLMQLIGYEWIQGNSGPYNAICSTYPMINLVVAFFFFQQRNLNLPYVLPAMFLIILGVVLLAIAPPLPGPTIVTVEQTPPIEDKLPVDGSDTATGVNAQSVMIEMAAAVVNSSFTEISEPAKYD